ncbi:MAG: hypothetical protein E6R12_12845 [Sphingomonadales bacterium]|nr:MAG: hypothetical protein E6R12_12845 [Sphingomonadales bacterium]
MRPALTIAVAGLNDATRRINAAATSIVQRPAAEAKSFQEALAAQPGQAPAPTASLSGQSAVPLSNSAYVPSLAEDIVNTKLAVASYKANASLIRTIDTLQRSLIESLR